MNKITKVGPNNVEVTPSKEMVNILGETVVVWDESNKQSYGQTRIDNEIASATASKDEWAGLDAGQYGIDKEAEYQDKLDKLNEIKEAMNG
jgi:hypothetical protein